MKFIDRLDDEHRTVLEQLPPGLFDLRDIPAARRQLSGMFEAMSAQFPELPGIGVKDHTVPGPDGAPEVTVRVYTPDAISPAAPALYWIHGGGMVLGDVSLDDFFCKQLALEVGCIVASVEYRLAPEHPHPAPIEDCYAGLRWLATNATQLGIDSSRLAIGGGSSGGGLAASLALLARDRDEVRICYQLLIYPMLDDRNTTPSSHDVTEPKVWNREKNLIGWRALLGDKQGGDNVSPYAAAARAENLAGLPPAYICVGELDLFLNEDIEYASRLLQSHVSTELHVYPGAFHGSDLLVPMSEISKRWVADRNRALCRALHH